MVSNEPKSLVDYWRYPLDFLAYCFNDDTISKIFMCLHEYKEHGHSSMLIQALTLYVDYRGSNIAEFFKDMPYRSNILYLNSTVNLSTHHMNVAILSMLSILTPEVKDINFYNSTDRDFVSSILGLYMNHIHHTDYIDLPFTSESESVESSNSSIDVEE